MHTAFHRLSVLGHSPCQQLSSNHNTASLSPRGGCPAKRTTIPKFPRRCIRASTQRVLPPGPFNTPPRSRPRPPSCDSPIPRYVSTPHNTFYIMRPILLSGHERALTQIRYDSLDAPPAASDGASCIHLTTVQLTSFFIAITSMAISSSLSPRISKFASGSLTTASVSVLTMATSVPSGLSMSTPPPP